MSAETPDPRADRPAAFPWPPVLLLAAALAAWLMGRALPLPWPGIDDMAARAAGIGLGVAGLSIIVWAVATLHRHGTTIMPDRGAYVLVSSGPYRFHRNPMYLGWVLVFLGLAEVTKNLWFVIAGLVFAILVTRLAIIPEERHLEARFGDAYRDYKGRTRRWI
jgi:protein-S-isoprenylcysteine O-methyltransferase Ste14